MPIPPVVKDINHPKVNATFRRKALAVLQDLAGHGLKAVFTETVRTVARQQYLFAQGRTRPGPKVTWKDGVKKKSNHQSGRAADIAFVGTDGKAYWPPLKVKTQAGGYTWGPQWDLVRRSAEAHGLKWGGYYWDGPHLELP